MRFEHVNLTVSNLQGSMKFYRHVFGWELRWKGTTRDGQPAAHIGNRDFYLALFEARNKTPIVPADYDAVGINHFAFLVDDIDRVASRLASFDTHLKSDETYDPGRHAYFFDLDGMEIELVQYDSNARGSDGPEDAQ